MRCACACPFGHQWTSTISSHSLFVVGRWGDTVMPFSLEAPQSGAHFIAVTVLTTVVALILFVAVRGRR